MYSFNTWGTTLAIVLELTQAILVLWATTFFLKKRKLLQYPLGAMEYSTTIFCSVILVCALFLSAGSSEYFLRASKSATQTGIIIQSVVFLFSRYLLTTLCAEALFLMLSVFLARFLGQDKSDEELRAGNIAMAILCSGGIIGLAIVIYSLAQPIYESLTPVYFNFR